MPMVKRLTSSERRNLKRKADAGMLPPPECPACGADLRDPGVPPRYANYAAMFGLAQEVNENDGHAEWLCPRCRHVWGRHPLDLEEKS